MAQAIKSGFDAMRAKLRSLQSALNEPGRAGHSEGAEGEGAKGVEGTLEQFAHNTEQFAYNTEQFA